jgi:formylglycine-generating enzyme required for sulfatase activity
MKKVLISVIAALAGGYALASVPVVEPGSVTLKQEANRRVVIGYNLKTEAAIVTIDILTNGVSIGAANMRGMYGDVHVKVEPGAEKKAYWTPVKSWPNQVVADGSMTAVVKAWATNAPPEWMVVNLDKTYEGRADAVKYYTSLEQSPDGGDISNEIYKTSRIVLKRIPAAGVPFFMGSHPSETGHRYVSSGDSLGGELLHQTVLSSDFYLAVYETTQAQYSKIYGTPSKFFFLKDGAMRPAENMCVNYVRGKTAYWPGNSLADGYGSVAEQSFLGALRKHAGGTVMFDLPTEAQWEFACRAGVQTGLYTGEDITAVDVSPNLEAIARYNGNNNNGDQMQEPGNTTIGTDAATALVGSYQPNGFGLYDMIGNVQELCLDWKGDYTGDATDPVGPVNDEEKARGVCRGGSYVFKAAYNRSAARYFQERTAWSRATGLRICVPLNH